MTLLNFIVVNLPNAEKNQLHIQVLKSTFFFHEIKNLTIKIVDI